MDLDSLVQLISGVGFPIAACVALYLMNTKQLSKLTSIIENNTVAIIFLFINIHPIKIFFYFIIVYNSSQIKQF